MILLIDELACLGLETVLPYRLRVRLDLEVDLLPSDRRLSGLWR